MSDVASDLDKALNEMHQIMAGAALEPVYGAGRWPWETHVNRLATEANDVSLIPGVGAAKRQPLIESGYRTVDAVAAAQEESLTELRGIGVATAKKFITSARAINTSRPIRRGKTPAFPLAPVEVFFDLEGTDPRIAVDGDGLEVVNYLIGARGILKKCVNSQAVYPLSEQHGLKARERRYTAHEEGKHWE